MQNKRITIQFDIEICDDSSRGDSREEERFAHAIEYGLRYSAAIEELAGMCCQSTSTFKRRFRERYSMSPHKWFTIHKLELAYKIILERDVTIVELTKLCGFNNVSHFIAAFRKRYGHSPARLSKQLREEGQTTKSEDGYKE